MAQNKVKDLKKFDYERFSNIINHNGVLLEDTVYSFPLGTLEILDKDGKEQIELLNIRFEKGTHIEEVRRSMYKWAESQDFGMSPDAMWVHMGFYELMSDGVFRKVVESSNRLRDGKILN